MWRVAGRFRERARLVKNARGRSSCECGESRRRKRFSGSQALRMVVRSSSVRFNHQSVSPDFPINPPILRRNGHMTSPGNCLVRRFGQAGAWLVLWPRLEPGEQEPGRRASQPPLVSIQEMAPVLLLQRGDPLHYHVPRAILLACSSSLGTPPRASRPASASSKSSGSQIGNSNANSHAWRSKRRRR